MEAERKKVMGVKFLIARRVKNMTQKEIATRIGVHQAHYQRIESGTLGLTGEQLIQLCFFLGIEFAEINEIVMGVAARKNNDVQSYATEKNRLIKRIAEEEIRKRDEQIEKLKKQLNGFISQGYGFN